MKRIVVLLLAVLFLSGCGTGKSIDISTKYVQIRRFDGTETAHVSLS